MSSIAADQRSMHSAVHICKSPRLERKSPYVWLGLTKLLRKKFSVIEIKKKDKTRDKKNKKKDMKKEERNVTNVTEGSIAIRKMLFNIQGPGRERYKCNRRFNAYKENAV